MRWFVRRLAAVVAIAFVPMAAAVVATPGISSAECAPNMSWNPTTNVCKLPPPPPPTPGWARTDPVWSNGFQRWGIVIGGVWVPL